LGGGGHIEYIIPKLSSPSFAMSTVTSIMKTETLKLVYLAYFHSILSYRIFYEFSSTKKQQCCAPKRKMLEQWQMLKGESLEGNYLRNFVFVCQLEKLTFIIIICCGREKISNKFRYKQGKY
jgi:hypothetical protein